MYITTRFLGTQRGNMKYLFFLLTEDYIENQVKIREAIEPVLMKLACGIGQDGALVRPFRSYEKDTTGDIMEKAWTDDEKRKLSLTPGILIMEKDFNLFDPRKDKWLHISFRKLINSYGDVQIFELYSVFAELIVACKRGDLLDTFNLSKPKDGIAKILWDNVEIKPGVCGVSIDLKQVRETLLKLRNE